MLKRPLTFVVLAILILLSAGIADPNVFEAVDEPTLQVVASRSFGTRTSLTEANVANNAPATLSGSGQVAPNYWLDTKNGVSCLINVETPQSQMSSPNDLEAIPIDSGDGDPSGRATRLLGGLSRIEQVGMPTIASHHSITPTINVYASNQGRDLGAVDDAIRTALRRAARDVPRSPYVGVQGQAVAMA